MYNPFNDSSLADSNGIKTYPLFWVSITDYRLQFSHEHHFSGNKIFYYYI